MALELPTELQLNAYHTNFPAGLAKKYIPHNTRHELNQFKADAFNQSDSPLIIRAVLLEQTQG